MRFQTKRSHNHIYDMRPGLLFVFCNTSMIGFEIIRVSSNVTKGNVFKDDTFSYVYDVPVRKCTRRCFWISKRTWKFHYVKSTVNMSVNEE